MRQQTNVGNRNHMKNILITGATGNIGREVIRFLYENNTTNQIIAGVRNIEKARKEFEDYPLLQYTVFDFEHAVTFENALLNIDSIFLLRPPHISDISYFDPLVKKLKEKGINQVVFLSVQGAEKSKVIPHNKIEALITASGINYIFLRPSYFMQNLTTTLLNDIRRKGKIILPAGKAKFNWIDIENIGEVAAHLLNDFENYQNRVIELTGYENKDFYDVSEIMSTVTGIVIRFDNTSLLKFYRIKKREGLTPGFILVMMMLHFLPRFQKEPVVSEFYEQLTGKNPTTLNDFVKRECQTFTPTK